VDVTYKREVTVGALVLVGFVVFTGFMFWLTGRSIVSKAIPVDVVFKNISGLKEGDPVRVFGREKGAGRPRPAGARGARDGDIEPRSRGAGRTRTRAPSSLRPTSWAPSTSTTIPA